MYAQYQQYQQQGATAAVSTNGMTWNGTAWQPSSSSHSTYSTYQTPAAAPAPAPGNSHLIQQYTTYYHQWTSRQQEQEKYAQSLPLHSTKRDDAQRQADWSKYYADQSSRAAHHFYQTPNVPFPSDLPPAPPSTPVPQISQTQQLQYQQQSQQIQPQYQTQQQQPPVKTSRWDTQQSTGATSGGPPDGLKRYVSRCLDRCTTDHEKGFVQKETERVIATALQNGTLHSANWDAAPLIPLPKPQEKRTLDNDSYRGSHKKPKLHSGGHYGPSSGDIYQQQQPAASYYGHGGSSNNNQQQQYSPTSHQRSFQQQKLPQNDSYYGNVSDNRSVTSQASLGEQDFLALPGGNKKGRHNKKDKTKNQKSPLAVKDGFERSSKALKDRSSRFSGPGGLGEASLVSYKTDDKYLGKGVIGGSRKKLDETDYENMTVKGTCMKLEKSYLRLTSPPRPQLVRPLPILEQHVENLKSEYYGESEKKRNYEFFVSQFKAVRQDLTVQRIQTAFSVDVYETHARIALQEGDLNEFNQCQTQLKELYKSLKDDPKALENLGEFLAYRLIYYVFLGFNKKYTGGSSDLLNLMLSLTPAQRKQPAIKHALQVRSVVADVDYHAFFQMKKGSPNIGAYLMDYMVPNMRHWALQRMCRAYRPTADLKFVLRELGFEIETEKDLEEGRSYLESCGCLFTDDGAINSKDCVVRESDLHEKKSLI